LRALCLPVTVNRGPMRLIIDPLHRCTSLPPCNQHVVRHVFNQQRFKE